MRLELVRTDPGVPAFRCLACGDPLTESLRRAASLRCDECRHAHAPLDPRLVEPQVVEAPERLAA